MNSVESTYFASDTGPVGRKDGVQDHHGSGAADEGGRELTTQQAADLLNVSRQYLVRLLDENRIAFRKTGQHRLLRIEDVLEFKKKRDKERRAGLRELSRMTQKLRGYDAEVK
jgi:excisionase family DNA binding protein